MVSVQTWPNPTSDLLNVSWTANSNETAVMTLTDISGKELYRENVTGIGVINSQINLADYKSGAYIVKVVSNDNAISKMVYRK